MLLDTFLPEETPNLPFIGLCIFAIVVFIIAWRYVRSSVKEYEENFYKDEYTDEIMKDEKSD
jgi:hypothetical protein